MRPTVKPLNCVPLTMAALTLLVMSPARAGLIVAPPDTGIIVDTGTVQPIGDPLGIYNFAVEFKPVAGESIQFGDSFTVTSTTPLIPLIGGTNSQPPLWAASFSNGVPGTTYEYYTVTWTYIDPDKRDAITKTGSLDPSPPFFQVLGPGVVPGNFSYTFTDTFTDPTTQNTSANAGNGSFTVFAIPEPSTLIPAGFGATAGLVLLCRSRRRAVA